LQDIKTIPVILCGGIGSRLWPVSRENHPKQFLKINSEYSLFQRTVLRTSINNGFLNPIIVCNENYKFKVAAELEEIAVKASAIITETEQKNTSSAVALAAHYIKYHFGEEHNMLVMPSDHIIKEENVFIKHVQGCVQKINDQIVTFGIKPRFPSECYGYIKTGSHISDDLYHVEEFVEKPNTYNANIYIKSDCYFWNSGIFLFSAKIYLEQLKKCIPENYYNTEESIIHLKKNFNFIQPDQKSFARCKNISIDYGILEKSNKVTVKVLDINWYDLGAWESIYEYCRKDKNNNAVVGSRVHSYNSKDCLIYSNSQHHVVLNGLKNLSIIVTDDAILVSDKNSSDNMKKIYDCISRESSEIIKSSNISHRPWGQYKDLLVQDNYRVKLIQLNPHSKISLQYHHKRAEHWVITKGVGHIKKGGAEFVLNKDESTYIPRGETHMIENKFDSVLEFIEVQVGEYVGEDDIVRIENNIEYQQGC
jgi:mannose-1-phosphate guanylyltransferase/mannose-6-phosphate isomerase